MHRSLAAGVAILLLIGLPAAGAEMPKRGGTLTYMIPADAPPSFDGHREAAFETIHAVAPFYSVLVRVNPENPASTTDFVCDVCTEIPEPADGGRTYAFPIREDVRFQDGSALTAHDVAASWNRIVDPPEGVISARRGYYSMIDKVEARDPKTVIFQLKFATAAFLPALADPYAFIYKRELLDHDPHWFEKNIMGSGPFRFKEYQAGQSISGVRNPDYYHRGLPYLDGFTGIFADKQSIRVSAIKGDRAAIEFRGFPPSTRDELVAALGDQITVQESDWYCGNLITPNHKRKPFDDVRVRRALSLAIDRWRGAPALSKISVMKTVGGVGFPGSPLAATKEELEQIAGFWPDIEKSRAEARRLLKEAGAENLTFEFLNRGIDQPYKYVGTWLVDEWSKIGVQARQRVLPTGPLLDAERSGNFEVALGANCHGVPNPLLDVQAYLPSSVYAANYGYYEDQQELDLYGKMLRETDLAKQRALMRDFEKYVVDTEMHEIWVVWWYRIIPHRSYVKGWKISPSHFINQDLATVWLDK